MHSRWFPELLMNLHEILQRTEEQFKSFSQPLCLSAHEKAMIVRGRYHLYRVGKAFLSTISTTSEGNGT